MLQAACTGCHQRCFARNALLTRQPLCHDLVLDPQRPAFSILSSMTGTKRTSRPQSTAASNGDAQLIKKGKTGNRNMAVELLEFINEAWTQFHAVGMYCTCLCMPCVVLSALAHRLHIRSATVAAPQSQPAQPAAVICTQQGQEASSRR